METLNSHAPPQAVSGARASPESAPIVPRLWNPDAAVAWSLLFTPIFGAVLHMLNWRAMGDRAHVARARVWAIGLTGATALLLLGIIFLHESDGLDGVLLASGFVLLAAWYFLSAREQSRVVRSRFGRGYPHRGWGRPVLLAVAGYTAFFLLGTGIDSALRLLE